MLKHVKKLGNLPFLSEKYFQVDLAIIPSFFAVKYPLYYLAGNADA
ncbi:MAG: hypothetical protein PHY54_15895 [Methylococcales bacterium]|nr:hypothetical protein [Methylococcales bacterium]